MQTREAVSSGEASGFRLLLGSYGLEAKSFEVWREHYASDYGPAVALVIVQGSTQAVYSCAEGGWLEQLHRDLRAGLYQGGTPPR